MALAKGTRLGPYEILGTLGAGGMGEVYRATDTNLGRAVAIKVLPEAFAHDADRLARFEREARTLAALNHPNIAAVYGLEKSSAQHALVMELVEGPTLADRITGGAIPVEEALPIAKQIAEALEAAHEHGIIHRDLKPANVKVRPDGTVKVLDFGLAKVIEPVAATSTASLSPTITTPAMTQIGMILGTAAYMSPEQAKGHVADKRSDVWSFGCLLYEMLTGRRAFDGEDTTDVLGAVVRLEPDWNAIPSTVPPLVHTLLRGCLLKDRRQRVADVSAALFVLKTGTLAPATDTQRDAEWITRRAARRRLAMWSVAAVVIGAAAAAGLTWVAMRPGAPRVTRLTIVPPSTAALALGGNTRDIAISPDGSRVVYLGNNGRQLFMRALDQLDSVALTPLGSPAGPFFSPDGLWVGYFEGPSTIMKVAITGGAPLLICKLDGAARGATWGPAGTIIFATNTASSGLQQVSEAGGQPTTITKPNTQLGEVDHLWPEMLPGGRAVLFSIIPTTGPDTAMVAVLDLQKGEQKILVRGGADAHYLPSGHLVYSAAGTLRAVSFDLDRLEAGVTPVPVVSEVVRTSVGAAEFDVARDGTLAYVSGAGQFEARTFVWVDREGKEEPLGTPLRAYAYPRLSPDGSKLAVAALDQERDIWIWDLKRQGLSRFTLDANEDRYPLWTPDGQRLMWDSTRNGPYNLFWQASDGSGTVERLTDSPNTQAPHSLSPDGKQVVLREDVPGQGQDLVLLTLDGKRSTTPLLHAPYNERNGEISPNGKWLAYESDESGRFEIYVRPFPNVESGKSTISRGGGQQAAWSPEGRQLFYRGPDGSVVGVTVDLRGGFEAGPPQTIVREGYFTGGGGVFGRTYDVSGDGKRFLMIKQGGANGAASTPSITIVQNWLDELKRVVSVK